VRVEDAIAARQWFAGARVRGITHTICPGCIDRFGM
jgi:hypothetical protein